MMARFRLWTRRSATWRIHQRGVELTDAQIKSIETWMGSLTGEIPMSYIKLPELPKSTSQTPTPSGE